jgi:SAM-dependent MidA family methyltransferase
MVDHAVASEKFRSAFRARTDAHGKIRFDQFVDIALYDASVGYYQQPRPRVGTSPGTDFLTATSTGPVFGELIVAACTTLLGSRSAGDFDFIEIGSESAHGILANVASPFKTQRTVRVGESWDLRGDCVVFSNELFDAQPFRRFVRGENGWTEIGVGLRDDGTLFETPYEGAVPEFLPLSPPPGYIIDVPLAAVELLRNIVSSTWKGLFIACDYGKSWLELTEACPAGTARAYFQHTQSNDLLARPGEQDLTCHICWDWMLEALDAAGFQNATVESQESFLVRRAQHAIATISAAEAHRFSARKNALLQLLHPNQFGQKFQVLHGSRL